MTATGPALLFRTALLYSLVEYRAGHLKRIDVTVQGNTMAIADDGRGHAIERKIDGLPYIERIYGQLHPTPAGLIPELALHSLGVSLFSAFCSELVIEARRGDDRVVARFADGALVALETQPNHTGTTGNSLRFTVSSEKLRESASAAEIGAYLSLVKTNHPALVLTLNDEPVEAPE